MLFVLVECIINGDNVGYFIEIKNEKKRSLLYRTVECLLGRYGMAE